VRHGEQTLSESYSEEETERRAPAALKRKLQMPHKPHKEAKYAALVKVAVVFDDGQGGCLGKL